MQRCQDRGPWQQKNVCVCVRWGVCCIHAALIQSGLIQAALCVCVCVCVCVRCRTSYFLSVESRVTPVSCDCCCCFSRTHCSSHEGLNIHQSIITQLSTNIKPLFTSAWWQIYHNNLSINTYKNWDLAQKHQSEGSVSTQSVHSVEFNKILMKFCIWGLKIHWVLKKRTFCIHIHNT